MHDEVENKDPEIDHLHGVDIISITDKFDFCPFCGGLCPPNACLRDGKTPVAKFECPVDLMGLNKIKEKTVSSLR